MSEYSDLCSGRVRASSTMSRLFGTDAPEHLLSTYQRISTHAAQSSLRALRFHSLSVAPNQPTQGVTLSQPSAFCPEAHLRDCQVLPELSEQPWPRKFRRLPSTCDALCLARFFLG